MDEKFATGELRFSEDETRVIRRTYLKDMEGLPPSTIWTNFDITGHTRKAKYELKNLFPDIPVTSLFSTPKPELLINYIFNLSTNKGDLVMDFFLGSGTTAAVAHKMGLKYIGVEQMEYINEFVVPRLIKVINAEQGGITKNVNWEGGGSFVYLELMVLNQKYIDAIATAKTSEELNELWTKMKECAFLSYKVDVKAIDEHVSEFETLAFDAKKRFLIEVLDKNMLYVNYCDINDEDYSISENSKLLNKSFYEGR